MKKVFIAIGAVGLGYGIYQYYLTQGAILYNYKYSVVGVVIKKVTLKEVEIEIDVEIINDSAISATLTNYYFDIFLNFFMVIDKEDGTFNDDRKELVMMYLKGWFTIDFAAVFPFDVLLTAIISSESS